MDMMTAIFAANKAKNDLVESGSVGYTETTQKVILDCVLEASPIEGMPNMSAINGIGVLDVRAGEKLLVTWNGKQYTCVAVDTGDAVLFGNLSIIGVGDDTGEPFVYAPSIDEGGNVIGGDFVTTDTGSISLKMASATETVHPIDPKYLPSNIIKVNLLDYGVDLVAMMAQGGGIVVEPRLREVLELVTANPDHDVVIQVRENNNVVTEFAVQTKVFASGKAHGLIANFTMITSIGNQDSIEGYAICAAIYGEMIGMTVNPL